MLRSNLVLQVAILLTLLAGIGLNLAYWRTQRAFNESTLERLHADEAILGACGCGARQAAVIVAGSLPSSRLARVSQGRAPR
jgi:hypothetical protein